MLFEGIGDLEEVELPGPNSSFVAAVEDAVHGFFIGESYESVHGAGDPLELGEFGRGLPPGKGFRQELRNDLAQGAPLLLLQLLEFSQKRGIDV
jgi:hypothetical protein